MTVRPATDPGAFPADPPSDPDCAGAIATHDWAAFGQVTTMVNHWSRPNWSPGTRAVYWLLTFSEPLLVGQVQECQAAIRHLGFDEIDRQSLHLTLGRIGLAEDLSLPQLKRLAAAVPRHRLPPAFPMTAIPMTASRGAVRFSVAPWTPVIVLHATLARAGRDAGLPPMNPSEYLRPHLGSAYCNRSLPASEVRATIEPLRRLPPVPLLVDRVQIVEMWRIEGAYQWRVVEEVSLPAPS